MAKEYIERSKAINEIRDTYEYEYPTASGAFDEFVTMLVPRILNNLPAADVVEVVRCNDCKHWGGVVFGYRCRKFSGMNTQIQTSENDFCSCGKRKEGADE